MQLLAKESREAFENLRDEIDRFELKLEALEKGNDLGPLRAQLRELETSVKTAKEKAVKQEEGFSLVEASRPTSLASSKPSVSRTVNRSGPARDQTK